MNSEWLETQFNINPGKSKASLARAIGLEPSAISKILKGSRQIKASEYAKMRDFFGLDQLDKAYTSVIRPLVANANDVASSVAAQMSQESWVIPSSILEQRANTAAENISIYTIEDSFMEPDFIRGEHVLVDMSKQTPSPPGCYAISDGYGVFLRFCEIVHGQTPTEIKLHTCSEAFSPQKIPLENIKVLGKVVAKLQWL